MALPFCRQRKSARQNDAVRLTVIRGSGILGLPHLENGLPERKRFGGLFFCRLPPLRGSRLGLGVARAGRLDIVREQPRKLIDEVLRETRLGRAIYDEAQIAVGRLKPRDLDTIVSKDL